MYPRKTLRYEICQFLLAKKREDDTIGRPLVIRLSEMEELLQYAVSSKRDNRIDDLAIELNKLNDERFGDKGRRVPLEIENMEIFKDFASNFEANEYLMVQCSSKDLEDYIETLKEATSKAERAANILKIEDIQNGGVRIISGNKSMSIRGGRGLHLQANIVKLMVGGHIDLPHRPKDARFISISLYHGSNYDTGDYISFSEMSDILREIENDGERPDISVRSVRDAVNNINMESIKDEKLGKEIFEINSTDGSFCLLN